MDRRRAPHRRSAERGWWCNVSLAETLRRHRTRPQAEQFTTDDTRGWYTHRDLLGLPGEQLIPESSTLDETVAHIAQTAGLPLAARAEPPTAP